MSRKATFLKLPQYFVCINSELSFAICMFLYCKLILPSGHACHIKRRIPVWTCFRVKDRNGGSPSKKVERQSPQM